MRVGSTQPKSFVKTAAKAAAITVGTAAVAAGTIALLTRKGTFDYVSEKNPVLNKIKKPLRKFGDAILNLPSTIKTKYQPTKEVAGFFNKVECFFKPEKFNPDLASAASKTAETFNSFVA